MFWHNFKYSIKTLLKDKILIFWTLAFPIFLGIFFFLAFSDIEKNEMLDVIPIAVVENEEFHQNVLFQNALKSLSKKDDKNALFTISYVDKTKAEEMLENKEITGYLTFDDDVLVTVNEQGVEETIIRYVVDEIISTGKLMQILSREMITNNQVASYQVKYQELYELASSRDSYVHDISNQHISYTMIEYYTLIAMSCLYGGMLSMVVVNSKLANMSSVGKRTAISGISKGRMLMGSLCASYLIQLVGIFILFLFTIFVLHVDYGNHLCEMILLAGCGSFAGLMIGVTVATLVKASENAKTGILIAITMLGCFLSGMMGVTMKYVIDKNVPIFNMINPASMITDGFYSLYYYDASSRFIFDVVSLVIFSIVLIFISLHGLRRQKYECI